MGHYGVRTELFSKSPARTFTLKRKCSERRRRERKQFAICSTLEPVIGLVGESEKSFISQIDVYVLTKGMTKAKAKLAGTCCPLPPGPSVATPESGLNITLAER